MIDCIIIMEDIFDALDSFEVREVLPETLSTSKT